MIHEPYTNNSLSSIPFYHKDYLLKLNYVATSHLLLNPFKARSEMALDFRPKIEKFNPLLTPRVRLHEAALDAGSRPLAKLTELVASPHNYIAVIELPRVEFGGVGVGVSVFDEVYIEGQITPGAIFADVLVKVSIDGKLKTVCARVGFSYGGQDDPIYASQTNIF
ncbi:hypothetical protein Tco_0020276 [Tanacetum coccineum]